MPDHLHLLLLGLKLSSDQLNAVKFLRLQMNRLLAGEPLQKLAVFSRTQPRGKWRLQPQAHDHVLREEERKQGAFASVCFYILANPVRKGLATKETEWHFSGAVIPGYPDLHPLTEKYWELFWKLYYKQREPTPSEPPTKVLSWNISLMAAYVRTRLAKNWPHSYEVQPREPSVPAR